MGEMIELAGMLMVGSLGRGLGKTELSCSLIKKFGPKCDIVGIKVTPTWARLWGMFIAGCRL